MKKPIPFPCGECGQVVTATELHTYEDCLRFKAAKVKP